MSIKSLLYVLVTALLFLACSNEFSDPQNIIDRAIEEAGGERYDQSIISFDFREHSYSALRDKGLFEYTRRSYISPDSILLDKLHNYGFQRTLNDSMVSVPDSMVPKYTASINSVIYFLSLPYGLNDPAVNKELIGTVKIKDQFYYKIKVWFDQEGGGEDFNDEFAYWINTETFHVDYLAYSYETNGGGMRFRRAYHPRDVNGIRIVDYVNYKPKKEGVKLLDLDQAYLDGELEELSRIENDRLKVTLLSS